jgi:hypothetical protein
MPQNYMSKRYAYYEIDGIRNNVIYFQTSIKDELLSKRRIICYFHLYCILGKTNKRVDKWRLAGAKT